MTGKPLVAASMILIATTAALQAQTKVEGGARYGVLLLEPADPCIWSLLDGHVLGRGPMRVDSVLPGRHTVRSIPRSLTAWESSEFVDTVDVQPGDTVHVHFPREGSLFLESVPTGARVMLGDSLLGNTPVVLPPSLRLQGAQISIERDGFHTAALGEGGFLHPLAHVTLEPLFGAQPGFQQGISSKFSTAGAVLTGTGAIIAGVAAAWLKNKADAKSQEYISGGNSALRAEIDRLDSWGAVSLFICQGLLVYLALQLLAD
jgi:hypothetical protein